MRLALSVGFASTLLLLVYFGVRRFRAQRELRLQETRILNTLLGMSAKLPHGQREEFELAIRQFSYAERKELLDKIQWRAEFDRLTRSNSYRSSAPESRPSGSRLAG